MNSLCVDQCKWAFHKFIPRIVSTANTMQPQPISVIIFHNQRQHTASLTYQLKTVYAAITFVESVTGKIQGCVHANLLPWPYTLLSFPAEFPKSVFKYCHPETVDEGIHHRICQIHSVREPDYWYRKACRTKFSSLVYYKTRYPKHKRRSDCDEKRFRKP